MPNIPYPLKIRVYTSSTFAAGDVTLTLHKPDDSVVATVTNANATSGASGFLDFPLNQVVSLGRVARGAEYHFHLTDAAASATVYSAVANDAMGINFRLIGVLGDLSQYNYNGRHWMAMVDRRLAIGNLGFVALVDIANGTWVDSNFHRDYVSLIDGDKSMVGMPTDEYLIASAVTANGKGRLYFWTELGFGDTENHAYNFMIDTDSYVESMKNYQNITYLLARGVLHAWDGGKGVKRIHRMIELDEEYSDVGLEGWIEAQADSQLKIEVPSYMDVYGGLLRISPLGSSLSAVFLDEQNYIFNYGRLSDSYPLAMARGQKISGYCQGISGSSDNMVMATLDPERVGVSKLWYIDRLSPPCAEWGWEGLRVDTDNPYKEKLHVRYVVSAKELYPLSQIRLVAQEDGREPEYSDWYNMGESRLFYLDINYRSTSLGIGFEGETLRTPTIGQPPIITSWALEIDDLRGERQI
jgi:hypothetical protein